MNLSEHKKFELLYARVDALAKALWYMTLVYHKRITPDTIEIDRIKRLARVEYQELEIKHRRINRTFEDAGL